METTYTYNSTGDGNIKFKIDLIVWKRSTTSDSKVPSEKV